MELGTSRWKDWNRRIERLRISSAPPRPPPPDSEPDSSSEDHEGNATNMDLNLYRAATKGDVDDFVTVVEQVATEKGLSLYDVFHQVSPIGNTYLHIAAISNSCGDMLQLMGYHYPPLITEKNLNGDTALHLAARYGNSSAVGTLIQPRNYFPDLPSAAEGGNAQQINFELLRLRNGKGNTALHEVLMQSHYNDIADMLIKADPELAFCLNNALESPLYLAVKAGIKDLISLILSFPEELANMSEQMKAGKSPLHAAIGTRNIDVLQFILQKAPEFLHLSDEEGRFPLHYAASMGYLNEVRFILNQCPPSAIEKDKRGFLPIRWASIEGHVAVIKELLLHCPEPRELLDQNGRSILHFAAKNGKHEVVRYILKDKQYEELVNMKDRQGNTPLHLAAMHWHPKIVSALTWNSRVNLALENDEGMTALDAAECYIGNASSFQQRLTWAALRAGGVPRALPRKLRNVDRKISMRMEIMNSENYKDRVNTLLLVSTLVAIITFAAGLTMPGGYNNSDPSEAMATMLKERKFHLFIFCDMMAMYSSIIVAVTLIWAQRSHLKLVLVAHKLALPLLGIALAMMSLAFMAGVSLVVSKLRWLDNAILIMGVIFVVILLALFFPLCFTILSNNRLLCYIFYYAFCVLIHVTKDDPELIESRDESFSYDIL
ncbi:hypothetical protein ACH5RR_028797 [Cinchona calisaya]|uniref:PGG domain-containing protein n=1 Tax=Cinchona calisaya TaxID=153742 RepID=A0ABD2YS12_9GENT